MSGGSGVTISLISLLLGSFACGNQVVEFPLPELSSPTIVSTTPLADATSVPADGVISAAFSEPMRGASIDAVSFSVTQGSLPVAGVITLDASGHLASFHPVALLTAGLRYTATLTTAATSRQGVALAADYRWSFTRSLVDVLARSASAERVAAPDYVIDTTGLSLLTDANGIVQSMSGSAELRAGATRGQSWVVLDAADIDTYAEIDAAFRAASAMPITLRIPADTFALMNADLSVPERRTLIVANVVSDVSSYQAFEITFRARL